MKKKDEQTIEKQSAESAEAVETVETAEQNAEKSDVQAQLKAANEATASAVAAAEDFKRKWYSVTAEYDNYRKRTAATRTQAYAEGRADVVSKLFPIADNLERAIAACNDENTRKGIEMVTASFLKLLDDEKITVIDPVGEPFDPEKCEAIMAQEAQEGEESGTVKQVFLKGYEQNGKVLRFAQVLVIR